MRYIQQCSLATSFFVKHGDVISFIGSGGKTTSMTRLANEVADRYSVAVTTTVKMAADEPAKLVPQVAFYGIRTEEKITAPQLDCIASLVHNYDVLLIEADGSKKKAVKAWANYEPCVPQFSTKTVGVISTRSLHKPIESVVHRPSIFCAITHAQPQDALTLRHLIKIMTHPHGLFAKSVGKKYLLVIAERRLHEKIRTMYNRQRRWRSRNRGHLHFASLRLQDPRIGSREANRYQKARCL